MPEQAKPSSKPSSKSERLQESFRKAQIGRQRFLETPAGSALLGERDAFPLPLADQSLLEFGERPHGRQHQVRHRRILAGEGQYLLTSG